MKFGLFLALISFLSVSALHAPLSGSQRAFSTHSKPSRLISDRTEEYIDTLLKKWNSSGLSIAVVRRDETSPSGWKHEFGAYGIAHADGSSVTPDSVFAIASNSKLFLAISVGLLISNKTLAEERGVEIKWSTKIQDLIPEWKLMDEIMDKSVTLQDMLSHRTGMPRHDFSGTPRKGGISEMISTMRYLRPSAEFRETFQYNNLMYETLSYLPQVLLNQTYESYISQHLFEPLNMSASTLSVAEAEARGTLANGFRWDMQDLFQQKNGTLEPTNPYFARPGEERIWAGAGGVLSSAKDLAVWVSMLLNNGRHPYTNQSIVPEDVIEHLAYGRTASDGKPEYPELSPKVYGGGQWRYSYQGHDIIEHGGHNPGYSTQVARFPNDNLGIIGLSNDDNGGFLMEAVKWRIADETLGLKELDWNDRYEKQYNDLVDKLTVVTPRPSTPVPPSSPLTSLAKGLFSHPTYGTLKPCIVLASVPENQAPSLDFNPHEHCDSLLKSNAVQRILNASDLSVPTYIIPWKRYFVTHLRLSHFSGNLFNVTTLWTNADAREKEGYQNKGRDRDILTGFNLHFEVEWVTGNSGDGLAFKRNFWGMEGPDARAPEGVGKDSAEVWFSKVND